MKGTFERAASFVGIINGDEGLFKLVHIRSRPVLLSQPASGLACEAVETLWPMRPELFFHSRNGRAIGQERHFDCPIDCKCGAALQLFDNGTTTQVAPVSDNPVWEAPNMGPLIAQVRSGYVPALPVLLAACIRSRESETRAYPSRFGPCA